MPDEMEIGPGKLVFEDDYITITIPKFDCRSGLGEVLVDHKQEPAGNYYIWVHFESGDSTRLDYDGANPNNPKPWTINSFHKNDAIVKVVARKIR